MRPSTDVISRSDNNTIRTVNVHEHRAPTDQSIKLYEEMLEKAEARINKMVRVKNMDIDCVVHMMRSPVDLNTTFKAIFDLNGKRYTAQYTSHESEERTIAIQMLVQEVAKVIATDILTEAFSKCNWL